MALHRKPFYYKVRCVDGITRHLRFDSKNQRNAYGTLLFCIFSSHANLNKANLFKQSDKLDFLNREYGNRVTLSSEQLYKNNKGKNQ